MEKAKLITGALVLLQDSQIEKTNGGSAYEAGYNFGTQSTL